MRALLIAFTFVANATSQSTWIVDDTPGPGVHFTSLPAAVAAAANGDTLIVRPGSYESFRVSGKALSIRGAGSTVTLIDQPSAVPAADYVAIDAVPVGAVFRLSAVSILQTHLRRFVLRGSGPLTGAVVLDRVVSGPAPAVGGPSAGLGLRASNLLVHAQYCEFNGGSSVSMSTFSAVGHTGVFVDANATFVADVCAMRGGDGASIYGSQASAGHGLAVADATCRLSGCTIQGGNAHGGLGNIAYNGNGLSVTGSAVVTVAGTSADVIAGGSGTAAYIVGGNGISCTPPAAVVVHGAVTISGGAGAAPAVGSSITLGLPPLPRLRFTGATLGSGALPAGQPLTLWLEQAPPGQLFVLLADLSPGATALPGLSVEPLLVSATAAIASVGLLDANGMHTLTAVPATELPYVVGLATHWQTFSWNPVLGRWLGSNAALLRVEP